MPVATNNRQSMLTTTKRVNARAARNQFSDLVGQVHYTDEPVIIERSGKPMVVMLSVERCEQLLNEQSLPSAAVPVDKPIAAQVDDPLLGAFPELAGITPEDLDRAKQLLNQGVENQLRVIYCCHRPSPGCDPDYTGSTHYTVKCDSSHLVVDVPDY